MTACIVGWSHSPFGRLDQFDLENLIVSVTRDALDHARLPAEEVDAIWLGNLNGGFVPDIFCSSMVLQADDGLRWKPATRVENACASGAAAVYSAIDAIEAGRARIALVVGAEKMTAVSGAEITRVLGNASYVREEASAGLSFPGIFAHMAQAYFARHGDHSATLARIAAKGHANGVRNPWAQMRKVLGFEFCNTVSERNPLIAAPLRKTDCSLVSDGAAALIIAHESVARDFPRAVRFRARAHVSDYLPMSRRDPAGFEGPHRAWRQALHQAGIGVDDLSFAEVHDCFTIAELLAYEAMGLAEPGQGARVIEDGTVFADGRLPVNPSGGLKAKGHPIGATGVSMHVLSAMQLCGEAGDMQVAGARLAGVFNMGGSAVTSYVSILERAQ
ncbi:acetyl-CoA acetyltransferase [Thauera sinica]|uniref:Acetyl-CoA acetyltransferase n=1 Tax=Thauera sinica TaxID=2665146 RepID=A0ABW1ATL2_9RHOO|nr:acetyl-CoA acetyltransferase [Thauera sp. K11]ATE61353.1 acetyl-CoA acetyltransferase [Thauera sp. K11]